MAMHSTAYNVLANATFFRNKRWNIGQKKRDKVSQQNNQANPNGNPRDKTQLKQTAVPTHPLYHARFL